MPHTPAHDVPPHRAATPNRTDIVWEALRAELAHTGESGAGLDILDAGGGTGGAAVRLAELGHRVTVIDPNADSLAALERRAAERQVHVRALQGDTGDLAALLGGSTVQLALLHNVLEYVDDPGRALLDVAVAVRPGGAVSILAANAVAAVLHRALAGRCEEALHLLSSPDGRWGDADPMPRRFTDEQLRALARSAGLALGATRGVRVFADLLAGRPEGEHPEQALLELDRTAAEHPALRGIATQLHVIGRV